MSLLLKYSPERFMLVLGHRFESFGQVMILILHSICFYMRGQHHTLNWMVWDCEHCRPIFVRVGQDLDIKMFNIHQVEIESFYLGLAYILEKSLVERQRTMQRYGSLFWLAWFCWWFCFWIVWDSWYVYNMWQSICDNVGILVILYMCRM